MGLAVVMVPVAASERTHDARDDIAPIAALRHVLRVAEAEHELVADFCVLARAKAFLHMASGRQQPAPLFGTMRRVRPTFCTPSDQPKLGKLGATTSNAGPSPWPAASSGSILVTSTKLPGQP